RYIEGHDEVWINEGKGKFQLRQELGSEDTYQVDLKDIDNDNDLDIVTNNKTWINHGEALFHEQTDSPRPRYTPGKPPEIPFPQFNVTYGHLNDDGLKDKFVGSSPEKREMNSWWRRYTIYSGGWNKVYFNDGEGNYIDSGQELGTLDSSDSNNAGDYTNVVEIADVDNDGDLDVIEGNERESRNFGYSRRRVEIYTRVLINDGSGYFEPMQYQTLDTGNTRQITLNDFDQDGDLDLVSASKNGDALFWLNNGSGGFGNFERLGVPQQFLGEGHRFSVGDIDNDGDMDIFFAEGQEEVDQEMYKPWANQVWFNHNSGLMVYPLNIDFGTVYTGVCSLPKIIDIMNTGDLKQDIDVRIEGHDVNEFSINEDTSVDFNLNNLEINSLNIVFKPTTTGQKSAIIKISAHTQGFPNLKHFEVSLTGIGQLPPDIFVKHEEIEITQGGIYDFGSVGIGIGCEKEFIVTNNGSSSLELGDLPIEFEGSSCFTLSQVDEITTINPGEELTIKILFHPSQEEEYNASLTINSNDPDENPYKINLIGSGVIIKHVINAVASLGGNIEPSGEVEVIHGQECDFQIEPFEGNYIEDILIDGESVGQVTSYLFENVTQDHTIEAMFIEQQLEVSGEIRNLQGDPVGSVLLSGFKNNVYTDLQGNYKDFVSYGFTGEIVPLHEDYTFNPLSRIYTDLSSDQTVQDYIATPKMLDLYVDSSIVSSGNGLSWGNAKKTITEALEMVATHGKTRIHITSGEYVENIILSKNTELIGGYPEGGGDRDFRLNETIINGGGLDHTIEIGFGEGILVDGLTLTGGNALREYPHNRGGGIYCYNDRNTVVIQNCVIKDNSADEGGGIYYGKTNIWIKNCKIINNHARNSGGGIYFIAEHSYSAILNCYIANNSAQKNGGGIYGGDYSNIVNSTIINNNAEIGAGICAQSPYKPGIFNSIIYNNINDQIIGNPLVVYSCIQGGHIGEGNFDSDPEFVFSYYLSKKSPCIDAANKNINNSDLILATDLDGYPRIVNDLLDIGAFEFRDDLIVFLTMEEGTETTNDLSGNDNHGMIDGVEFVPGLGIDNSNAYLFSWSMANRIIIPYDDSLFTDDELTLEAWIYPTAWDNIYAHYNRIVSIYPCYLLRGVNGYAQFQILTENQGFQQITWGQQLSLNQWHYLVATFDGKIMKLYVNGQLRTTRELPQEDKLVTNTQPIYIGECALLNEGFSGRIDNIAVYYHEKKAWKVKQDYNIYDSN
ncbi:hypothetical protein BVX93_01310, partial [bacterium B13(2017)]